MLSSISLACKQIAAAVGRSGITSLTGVAGTGENVQVHKGGGGGGGATRAHWEELRGGGVGGGPVGWVVAKARFRQHLYCKEFRKSSWRGWEGLVWETA